MDTVREGTCGACKHFDYKGDDEKGYCNWIGAYYWPNDTTCRHYELDMSSGLSGTAGWRRRRRAAP